jgi:hypothetical protein
MTVTNGNLDELVYLIGNTEHVVPWKALQGTLDDQVPMTQRERCQMLLRAVNGDELPVADWNRLVGAPFVKGWHQGMWRLPEIAAVPLRAALGRVADDCETAINELGDNIDAIRNGYVLTLPEVSMRGRKVDLRERVLAYSLPEALIYALALFVDPEKPFGKLLRKCKMPGCEKFGFVDRPPHPGQPRNYYCGEEHESDYERYLGRERKAAARAGLLVDEYRRRMAAKARKHK